SRGAGRNNGVNAPGPQERETPHLHPIGSGGQPGGNNEINAPGPQEMEMPHLHPKP
ncbi:hypothetical protein L195_g048009, partial [Trifolium pratense]